MNRLFIRSRHVQAIRLGTCLTAAVCPMSILFAATESEFERLARSLDAIRTLLFHDRQQDVASIPPTLQMPALVIHWMADAGVSVELGHKMAEQIPNIIHAESVRSDHCIWQGDTEVTHGDMRRFAMGPGVGEVERGRVLATVLFTDIVDSTRKAAAMGDRRWRHLLDSHDELAQKMVERHRGRLIKSTGDGILATFDRPGRAVRCALALGSASQQIDLTLRAGLHAGEIEVRGNDIGGVAVHAAARVMAQCASNEVLVSRVVTDLVAGAGLKFAERGSYELKGLPGRWDLFAASA
jgi:class 3 adenylate cyclase